MIKIINPLADEWTVRYSLNEFKQLGYVFCLLKSSKLSIFKDTQIFVNEA